MKDFRNCSCKFSNGVVVVNTTPHSIRFQDGDNVIDVASSPDAILNATPKEVAVGAHRVSTTFIGNDEGRSLVREIEEAFSNDLKTGNLQIVGSIIAAQAYGGNVVGMTPAPGFERCAPNEKRMSVEKFTAF